MNGYNPYVRFEGDKLILRDVLAADRTVLANERTFLAYIRTALTLIVTGITFIKLMDSVWFEILGWVLIPLGLYTFTYGFRRYRQMYQRLEQIHLIK